MKRSILYPILVLLCSTPLWGQVNQKIKLTTSLQPDGKNTICIWPITTSGRIWVTGATLLDDEYIDGEPNYYTITSQEIVIRGDVTYLNVDDNHLTAIDLSENTYLRSLFCANNELHTIDLSSSGYLMTFDGHGNAFESIDFSHNKKLRFASIDRNRIQGENMTRTLESLPNQREEVGEVKVWVIDSKSSKEQNVCTKKQVAIAKDKNFIVLDWADGANNRKGIPYEGSEETSSPIVTLHTQSEIGSEMNLVIQGEHITLEGLELVKEEEQLGEPIYIYKVLSQNIKIQGDLIKLSLSNFEVDKIAFSGLATLQELRIKNNPLSSLPLQETPALHTLDCSGCPLNQLNLSNLRQLTYLDCSNCQLSTIDLSDCTQLKILSIYQNELSTLDITPLPLLTNLIASRNKLSTLNTTHNKQLTEIQADENALSEIDLSQNKQLEELHLAKNKFQTFDLKSRSIRELYINDNAISSMTLDAPSLEILCCYANQMSKIDLSKLPHLNTLSVHSNLLQMIDLTTLNSLEYLWIHNNQLTSLDLSKTPKLLTLECYSNALSEKATYALVKTLPLATPDQDATLIIINNPTRDQNVCNKSAVKIASDKNWHVYDFCEGQEGYPGLPYEGSIDTALAQPCDATTPHITIRDRKLSLDGATVDLLVELYDLTGRNLAICRGDRPMDLSQIPAGIYCVKVSSLGQLCLYQRIVVE